jgi:acetolactate synthase-1/2/3 large subunit
MITVSKKIFNFLLKKQIKHVFGYSGGAILPILNELNNDINKLEFIKNSTEQCSGFAAEGYSKSLNKNKPGVIITTSGPGVTNLITPLQDAYNDGIPLIAITGQVPTDAIGTDAFQECNATELTNACTKWNKILKEDDNIENVLNLAYNISMEDRKGPVHIDIPKNIMNLKISDNNKTKEIINYKNIYINNKIINSIIYKINKSKKPIIIAGQGCNNCSIELSQFAKNNLIPVTTTLHGVGCFDENNYLSLEWLGMHGNPVANKAVQQSDLIIAIGTRFDDRTTGNLRKYGLNAINNHGIIHIDSSIEQITKVKKLFDKYYDTDKMYLPVYSDSVNFFKRFNNIIFDKADNDWLEEIKDLKKEYNYEYNECNIKLKGPDVIKSINKYLDYMKIKNNTFITTGVGNHQMWTAQHIKWEFPNKLITSGSLGTMGVGVPFAIGAKLANPTSTVICIDGDSSFNMTSNELQTILENNIPIKIFILNDNRQQMVYIWQKLFHNNNIIGTENINPHYDLLGLSYGLDTVVCNNKNSLDSCVQKVMLNKGPVLGIFNIEPEMCFPLVAPGKGLDEMILNNNDINKLDLNQNAPN